MTRSAYAFEKSNGRFVKVSVDADDYNNVPDLHAGHIVGDMVALSRNGCGEIMQWGWIDCFFEQNGVAYVQIQITGGINRDYVGGCARKEVAKLPAAPVEEVAPLTLAKLNENAHEFVWGDSYRLRDEYAVGSCGSQRSFRGGTGSKTHALRISRVIEDIRPVEQRRRGTYQQGDNFSVHGVCNSNGQQNGRVNAKLDISDITCAKCRKALSL